MNPFYPELDTVFESDSVYFDIVRLILNFLYCILKRSGIKFMVRNRFSSRYNVVCYKSRFKYLIFCHQFKINSGNMKLNMLLKICSYRLAVGFSYLCVSVRLLVLFFEQEAIVAFLYHWDIVFSSIFLEMTVKCNGSQKQTGIVEDSYTYEYIRYLSSVLFHVILNKNEYNYSAHIHWMNLYPMDWWHNISLKFS